LYEVDPDTQAMVRSYAYVLCNVATNQSSDADVGQVSTADCEKGPSVLSSHNTTELVGVWDHPLLDALLHFMPVSMTPSRSLRSLSPEQEEQISAWIDSWVKLLEQEIYQYVPTIPTDADTRLGHRAWVRDAACHPQMTRSHAKGVLLNAYHERRKQEDLQQGIRGNRGKGLTCEPFVANSAHLLTMVFNLKEEQVAQELEGTATTHATLPDPRFRRPVTTSPGEPWWVPQMKDLLRRTLVTNHAARFGFMGAKGITDTDMEEAYGMNNYRRISVAEIAYELKKDGGVHFHILLSINPWLVGQAYPIVRFSRSEEDADYTERWAQFVGDVLNRYNGEMVNHFQSIYLNWAKLRDNNNKSPANINEAKRLMANYINKESESIGSFAPGNAGSTA
jgi:hypothetical protein